MQFVRVAKWEFFPSARLEMQRWTAWNNVERVHAEVSFKVAGLIRYLAFLPGTGGGRWGVEDCSKFFRRTLKIFLPRLTTRCWQCSASCFRTERECNRRKSTRANTGKRSLLSTIAQLGRILRSGEAKPSSLRERPEYGECVLVLCVCAFKFSYARKVYATLKLYIYTVVVFVLHFALPDRVTSRNLHRRGKSSATRW